MITCMALGATVFAAGSPSGTTYDETDISPTPAETTVRHGEGTPTPTPDGWVPPTTTTTPSDSPQTSDLLIVPGLSVIAIAGTGMAVISKRKKSDS